MDPPATVRVLCARSNMSTDRLLRSLKKSAILTSVKGGFGPPLYRMPMTIQESTTLFDMTETYPETIDALVDAGFKRMTDPHLRRRFGSSITVQAAAHARGMGPEDLLARLRAAIPPNPSGAGSAGAPQAADDTESTPTSKRSSRSAQEVPREVRLPQYG
jgi:hypothetical protein